MDLPTGTNTIHYKVKDNLDRVGYTQVDVDVVAKPPVPPPVPPTPPTVGVTTTTTGSGGSGGNVVTSFTVPVVVFQDNGGPTVIKVRISISHTPIYRVSLSFSDSSCEVVASVNYSFPCLVHPRQHTHDYLSRSHTLSCRPNISFSLSRTQTTDTPTRAHTYPG